MNDEVLRDAVRETLEENEDSTRDALNGDDGATNFLVGQVLQRIEGAHPPSDVKKVVKMSLVEDFDNEIDWPITTKYVMCMDQGCIGEELWGVFHDMGITATVDPEDTPDRYDEPCLSLEIKIHEDGSVRPTDEQRLEINGETYSLRKVS